MTHFTSFFRAALAGAVLLALVPSAHADEMTKQYSDMCVSATNFPKPDGEWDLKGHAKLPAYCACFGTAFKARALRPMKSPPETIEALTAEELVIRNTCRKQLGLPLAVVVPDEKAAAASAKPPKGSMAPKAGK